MPFAHAPTTDDAWAALLGPAMDATTEGVLVQDATGRIRAANAAARAILAVPGELQGKGPTGETHRPRHPSGALMAVEQQPSIVALSTGEPQRDVVVLLERDDANDVWLTVNAVPLFAHGAERPFGAIATFTDITAFIEAQQTLADRELDVALLAENSGDLIARHDADGRIVHAAGGAEALLGAPVRHLIGFWAGDICHPDDLAGIEQAHRQAQSGESSTISYRINHLRDGREIWLESTIRPVLDEDGGFIEAVTTTRDITARKRDEQRLRDAEERARAAAAEAQSQHELLEQAQAMADLGSWVWDPAADTVWWSGGAMRIFGMAAENADARAHDRLIHPDDRATVRAALWAAAREGTRFEHTYRLVRPDGTERIMHGRGRPAGPAADGLRMVAGTTQDVTDLHRLQASRREAEQRFRTAFDHAPIGICIVAADGPRAGQWLEINPAMAELLGWDRDELVTRPLREFVHPDDRELSRRALQDLAAGQPRLSVESRLLHRDGHVLWTLVTAAAVAGDRGPGRQAVLQVVDITERKRFEGQLQHLADHDTLTGLFNRRRFEEELDRVLAAAERYERPGAVVVLDLDGFKYVNDTMGHRAGDELMARLATTLRAELRESDVVARIGGDEFGIILPEAGVDQAAEVADKVLRAVARDGVVATETRHARVTASAGVAAFDGTDGLSAEEVLVEADVAMYDAKEGGRNRTVVHRRDPDAGGGTGRHASRLSWLERIRCALAEDRFELHAQPIVALAGDDVPAFELLLRMRTDDGDIIGPAAFLPVAERFDVIGDIDRWVARQAVGLLRREHAAGRDVTLSVNVSGRTVSDETFAGWLETLLRDEPVPHGRLIVEITETAAIVNLERARALGDALRRLGGRLALDDFGAGFASFSYLKHLRFDVLKIDGEFVRGLRDNPTDRLVVEAVVAIARGLGTPSLAEFVGDSDTLDAVRALGVDYAQGFHLGRPVPVEDALRLARSGASEAS